MESIFSIFYRLFQIGIYIASWFLPWHEPKLFTGNDALEKLAERLLKRNLKRICIVTDKGIVEIGLLRLLLNALEDVGIDCFIYDNAVQNPTERNAKEAAEVFTENKCSAFIALGGGSPIDCTKVAAALIAKPKKEPIQMKGLFKILKKLPPVFAIPTTAGTGSEVTVAAVISDSETHEKYAIKDLSLIPYGAVLDSKFIIGLPPALTATTGLDALAHAIEAFMGKSNTFKTKKQSLKAITLIFENLPLSFKDGANIEARENMQKAAYLAGLAFTRAYVGYAHAIAHALGMYYATPHGLAVAVTLPYVLAQYGEESYKKLAYLADHVGVSSIGDTPEKKARNFIDALEELNRSLNIQNSIPEIREEDIPGLAKKAFEEGNPEYPVPRVLFHAEFESLFDQIRIGKGR